MEKYVLNRIEKLEKKVEEQEEVISTQERLIDTYEKLLDVYRNKFKAFEKILEISDVEDYSDKYYVHFSSKMFEKKELTKEEREAFMELVYGKKDNDNKDD